MIWGAKPTIFGNIHMLQMPGRSQRKSKWFLVFWKETFIFCLCLSSKSTDIFLLLILPEVWWMWYSGRRETNLMEEPQKSWFGVVFLWLQSFKNTTNVQRSKPALHGLWNNPYNQGIDGCTPIPTYPYGNSLDRPYIQGYLWVKIPKNP